MQCDNFENTNTTFIYAAPILKEAIFMLQAFTVVQKPTDKSNLSIMYENVRLAMQNITVLRNGRVLHMPVPVAKSLFIFRQRLDCESVHVLICCFAIMS